MKNKGTWLSIIFFSVAMLFNAVACKKQNVETIPSEAQASDEALFKLGEQYIKKDQEKGILYLRQVMILSPKASMLSEPNCSSLIAILTKATKPI